MYLMVMLIFYLLSCIGMMLIEWYRFYIMSVFVLWMVVVMVGMLVRVFEW